MFFMAWLKFSIFSADCSEEEIVKVIKGVCIFVSL
jgi:hypothetical protein